MDTYYNFTPSQLWSLPASLRTFCVDNMPSVRTISTTALSVLGSAQVILGLESPVRREQSLAASSAVCHRTQISCRNTTEVENLCCFLSPGGLVLQTQFWDFDPATGPDDSWTVHGLWPDNCDGTYQQFCDPKREYTNITEILQANGDTDLLNYMQTYWASNTGTAESFWEHEWGKHGTCMSTFDANCYTDYQPGDEVPDYFQRTVDLFKQLPSYEWLSQAGIVPSTSKTYTNAQIQKALKKHHKGHEVYLGCTDNDELDEIWYYFNVRGSVQTGKFIPVDQSGSTSCPDTGIKYIPKGSGSTPTSTTTTTGPSPTSTTPFSGKGYLNAITSGSKKGCIISGGTWYTTGTCATYTATSSGDGFTLTSSKGKCAVQNDVFSCASSIETATVFTADGSDLEYDDSTTFYADAVPSGSTQGKVYTSADGHDVSLTIQWQNV
jgi:ribonuclease T2